MFKKNTILKNLLSNSIAEIANKGIAFLTTIYLTRVILIDGMGVIGIANSFVIYLTLFVNLGFNFIVIRDISKDKSSENIKKYVNNVVSIRFIISIISIILYSIFVYYLNKPIEEKIVIYICGFNVFATAFQLDWLYQAMEQMEILAIRQLLTGTLNLIGILLLVHNKSDITIAMIVMVATFFINSGWMFILYLKRFKSFKFSYDKIFWKYLLKQIYIPAIINLSLSINNYINLNILGFFSTNEQAGFFSLAFKIFSLCMMPATIIQITFYPIISRMESIEDRKKTMEKYSKLLYLSGSFISIFVFVYSDFFIGFFGNSAAPASETLRILMISLILTYLDTINVFPLIAWKKEKVVMSANLIANIFSILLNIILIPILNSKGAAIALVFSELIIFIITTYYIYKELKIIFIYKFVIFLFISIVAMLPSLINFEGNLKLLFMVVPIIIYILLNFGFKTVTIAEIKGLIKK